MSTSPGGIDYRALLQRAYASIETLQARLARAEGAQREPIAIVGMGVRFPGGAETPEAFWRLLAGGVDAVTEIPPDRWDVDAFYDPDPDTIGKSYSRWGAFLDRVDHFDPAFFGISPREAASMDPQQRLLLEVSWEALERAGHASAALHGSRTGVFVGMVGSDFGHLPGEGINEVDAYFGTGISRSIAAGRISYALGLHGPSIAIDTACSSSAVATHLAVQSLRTGDSDMALAGGVNLMLIPGATISASRARMLSPTGRCQAFAASADGYVRAEGCAMLVLKRLSDAIADRDHIHALILGSALNQDGRSNGITAPNAQAQEQLLRAALADAGVEPHEVGYVEAHGTGTALGDPIEMRALGAVFGAAHTPDAPLMIGSVKTNIGHTEGVAGTAGLIKLVLALQHRTIPPHLHLREPNPHIPWDALPVSIPTVPTPWEPREGRRRIGGVSSFGFSGTNSHLVVAEAPRLEPEQPVAEEPVRIVTLSARTATALEALADRYLDHLGDADEVRLAELSFTANTGRTHFGERLAVVAASVGEAREKLAAWRAGDTPGGVRRGSAASGAAPEVAFLFTGQGSQYVGMGRELYQSEPVFREALERCDQLLGAYLERPLLSVLYPAPGEEAEAERLIHQTLYTQPALFAVEYALAQLWRSWGIEPTLVLGHSVGEYVAACVAGVFGLEDGVRLIAERARRMQALPAGGAMAAVFADEETVAAAVAPYAERVSIAALNGPRNTVISGDGAAVRALLARLVEQGIHAKPLAVSHAFHSPLMEPMLDGFAAAAASVAFAAPRIGLVSNLTGRLAGAEIADAVYWREHVRRPVRFADGVRTLYHEGCTAFLEIGPAPTLLGMAQRCLDEADALWLPSLRPDAAGAEPLHESLATLYVHGAEVDWRGVERDAGQRRIPLPTYPFQRQRYWPDFARRPRAAERPRLHPLLDERIRSPLLAGAVFQSRLGVGTPAYLDDHRIFDAPLFPATGFLEMAWAAAREAFGEAAALEAVQIRDALVLPDEGEATVQLSIAAPEDDVATFQVFSARDAEADEWTLHATGQVRLRPAPAAATGAAADLEQARARCTEALPVDGVYERLAELGVAYGPAFRGLREVWRRDGEALARLALPEALHREAAAHQLHPALLDAGIQLLGAALPAAADPDGAEAVYVPVELGRYRVHRAGRASAWGQVTLDAHDATGEVLSGELRLFDADGTLVAEVGGMQLRRVTRAAIGRAQGGAALARRIGAWLYTLEWEPAPAPEPRAGWAAGRWLLLADVAGVADAVAARIEAEGGVCTLVRAGDVDPLDTQTFARLLDPAGAAAGGALRVVHLWSLDAPEAPTADEVLAQQQRVCGSALSLVQALVGAGVEDARLWMVTRGAQAAADGDAPPSPVQSPLWGLAHTIGAEHREFACVALDLDAAPGADPAAALAAELAADGTEDRVAWRDGGRRVARLARHAGGEPGTAARDDEGVALEMRQKGTIENLALAPAARRPPGAGEIEVRVRASGLNFRDVLNALDMYPGDAGPLGSECVGTVVGVGAQVSDFAVGDEVFVLAAGTFRSYLTVPARSAYPKPARLSFAEAATIPIAFLTAYYGLHDLAGIRPGDRVLVHAAAGGVGLAAVQLALRAGATVYGTAGSPEKRDFLRSLGVRHVMSSRTLDFAAELMQVTGGEGVTIVLNALADDFIPKSLAVLADHGCFLEIGKRGIWTAEQVAAFNPTLRYHAYDLADAIHGDHGWLRASLDRLLPEFETGRLRPLPRTTFPLDRAADAFRFMAQAKHTGKIVVTQEAGAASEIRGDATYLVTGGLGGLGLETARWLVERGARSIVLMGRRAPSEAAREAIAELERAGALVHPFQGDVASEADVVRLLGEIAARMPPLRGVIHAAGVLDDAMLTQQSWPRFETVMRPKVLGAWQLHAHTRTLPLDFFVLFSTGSALLGSAGQGNYAAANAFLDALAHYRHSLGLPATTINWGAWSDVGMAAALGARERERWREHGLGTIAPAEGVLALERALRDGVVQLAVLPFDWAKFARQSGAGGVRPILSRVAAAAPPPAATPDAGPDLLRQLEAAPPDERQARLQAYVEAQVRRVLALDAATRIDPDRGFTELGMDSLMAVELSNLLQAGMKQKLPSTLAYEHPTVRALTDHLAHAVLTLAAGSDSAERRPPPAARDDATPVERIEAVALLSEGEAEDTLLRALEQAGY